jgi:hypothetical protein
MLQSVMSYREFQEWAVWSERFPLGDEAQQMLLASFFATWLNSHKKRGMKKTKPTDVLPFYKKPEEQKPVSMDEKWKKMLGGFRPPKGKAN